MRCAALGDEEVRVGEYGARRLESEVVDPADRTRQDIGKISAQDGPDLGDFARFAKPVETHGEQRRTLGIACKPPASPPSSRRRVTSSTDSGTPPVRSLTPSTTSVLSAWRAASSPTICPTSARSRGLSEMTLW